jgi:trans-aconitate 2-methyltransferase
MTRAAAAWLGEHATRAAVVQADGAALPFRRVFDAVFSGATFHWILDHGALFRSIINALKPGGRLVAQCGGAGNISMLRARADRLRGSPRFASYFEEWTEPWYYADVDATKRRLDAAGFVDANVWLEPAPTAFDGPDAFREFVANVCVRHHLARLGPYEQKLFLAELTAAAAADSPAFTLDYWRLNIDARRPA